MLNNRVLAIIKRELREKLMSKAFIIATLSLPLIFVLIIGIQVFLVSFDDAGETELTVVTESKPIQKMVEKSFGEQEWVKDKSFKLNYNLMSKNEFDNFLKASKKSIVEGDISGIIFIPDSATANKEIQLYIKSAKNISLEEKLKNVINKMLVDNYLIDKNISQQDIAFIRNNVRVKSYKVSEDKGIEKDTGANLALAYVFAFLLYMSLLMIGSATMQSVIDEKNNRIVELILSSVSAKEFMMGKILGATITGFAQMAIWISPILIITGVSLPFLPPEIVISISTSQLIYFLINFFVGLFIFTGLFAAVGSMYNTPQEAQSGTFPLLLLIMIPFFLTFTMLKNPTNIIAEIASMVPFSSIIVMPCRIAVVDVPIWQIAVSLVVSLLTLIGIFPIAGKIYRIGILRTGKKPTLKEVVKWLKYKN